MSGYRQQVTSFIDFECADLRFNGEWLNKVTLPELVGVLARVPVSMSLQREDFRTRLAEGHGLSVAEFVYSSSWRGTRWPSTPTSNSAA
ncbi:hypothetical protein ACWDLL_06040 [Streptomyces griseoincarnatus]